MPWGPNCISQWQRLPVAGTTRGLALGANVEVIFPLIFSIPTVSRCIQQISVFPVVLDAAVILFSELAS